MRTPNYRNPESLAGDVESIKQDTMRLAPSREVSLAITKLDEAEFWLMRAAQNG